MNISARDFDMNLDLEALLRENTKPIQRRRLAISLDMAEDDLVMLQAAAVAIARYSPPVEPKPEAFPAKDEVVVAVEQISLLAKTAHWVRQFFHQEELAHQ